MRCPFCRSVRLVKHGFSYLRNGRKQRYLCRHCGRTTVNPKQ